MAAERRPSQQIPQGLIQVYVRRQANDADLAAGLMLLLAALLGCAAAAAIRSGQEHAARLDELALAIAGANTQATEYDRHGRSRMLSLILLIGRDLE